MYVVVLFDVQIIYVFSVDLHLPQEIVPATLKKSARPAAPRRACKYYMCNFSGKKEINSFFTLQSVVKVVKTVVPVVTVVTIVVRKVLPVTSSLNSVVVLVRKMVFD